MIDFGKYKYIGNHNESDDKSKYDFDDDYYQSLLNNDRYNDAADYLSNFRFNDAEEQEKHLHYIDELRNNGEIITSQYSKIKDKKELNSVRFADIVGTPNWYNNLRYKTDESGVELYKSDADFAANNPEATAVVNLLSNIGSNNEHQATRLSVTFHPDKVGWFNIGFLRKNTDDLDEFYSNGNFTPELLKSYGVDIAKNDATGETTITFDKTNEIALAILSALPDRSQKRNLVTITGYYADDNGKYHKIEQPEYIEYRSYGQANNSFGNLYYDTKSYNYSLAKDIKNIISDAQNKRDKIFEKRNLHDYEISSTVFNLKTDRTDILDEMFKLGQISEGEYNRRMKDAKDLTGWLRAQTYISGAYSNLKNDEYTDEHLESIGQEDWFEYKKALGEIDDKEVIIQGQVINGKLGLRFTLPQAQRKKRLASSEEGGFLHSDERNLYLFIPADEIPGMLGELQSQIDNDTELQAVQDFNNIVNYGVKKRLYTGETLQMDDNGNIYREYNGELYYDDRDDAKDRAIRDLNQTRILEKGKYLKFDYINNNGDINYARFSEDAKRYAILAGNDLIDGDLVDFDGNYLVTRNPDGTLNYGDLFDKGVIEDNYQYNIYRKILKIREIYKFLMDDIRSYNTINIE